MDIKLNFDQMKGIIERIKTNSLTSEDLDYLDNLAALIKLLENKTL